MIRRNPDLIAIMFVIVLLALVPAAARTVWGVLPERKVRLLEEHMREIEDRASHTVGEKLREKLREKLERVHISR